MAMAARQLGQAGLPSGSLRVTMFVFTLLCPLLLGMAIGVWGENNAGPWGARGVGAAYWGVVGWAWVDTGSFPVGFHLEGFETPLFVTVVNMGIFLMTAYFMQALGRSGGHLGTRFVTGRVSATNAPAPVQAKTADLTPSVPDVTRAEQSPS
jgi:hypothetical protein